MRNLRILILLILPLIFVLIGFQYKKEIISYSLTTVDPEMAYLHNSLAITQNYSPHLVEHPGFPLQYIGAAVIPITYLIYGNDSFEKDVISNPDLYIHSITIVIIFFLAILLFFLGFFTFRISNSIIAGIIIQLTPFISVSYLSLANRLVPEFLSLIVAAGFFIICLSYSYKDINDKRNSRYILYFALIAGLSISIKITFFPYIIIPLIVIRGLKDKLIFLLALLLSCTYFLLPVFNRFNYFVSWIKNLFIHSGEYGTGDSNILDTNLFKNNIISIYQNDPVFIFFILIIVVGLLAYPIKKLKIKKDKDRLYLSALSFTIASVLIVLLIAKQLKYYYLSPAYVLVVPAALFIFLIYKRNRFINKIILPISFLVIGFSIYQFEINDSLFSDKLVAKNDRSITKEFVSKKLQNVPVLCASVYYGSPFLSNSTFFGMQYCNEKRREELGELLVEAFPYIYNYNAWNNKFNYGYNIGYTLEELTQKYDSLYLYLGDWNIESLIEKEFLGEGNNLGSLQEIIFYNDQTGEKIIKFKHQ